MTFDERCDIITLRFLWASAIALISTVLAFAQQTSATVSPSAQVPTPPPSNEVTGIDINRFIGNPFHSHPHLMEQVILVRSILKSGNPYALGEPGAVLEYRKELGYGTLAGHNHTPLTTMPEQLFFYIESGTGRVDDGENYWDLRPGIGVLVPPGGKHRITNSSDEPLEMVLLTWIPPHSAQPASGIRVRNINDVPYNDCGGATCHWSLFGKNLFNSSHGLDPNEAIHIVLLPPMTIAEPHAHTPGWEEIWTKLKPNDSYLMLGSEIQEMPPHTAYLVPPNAKTVHSVINVTRDQPQTWLYVGRHPIAAKLTSTPLVAPKRLKAAE